MKLPRIALVGAAVVMAAMVTPLTSVHAAPKKKAPAPPVISATDTKALKANVGKEVSVEGLVVSTAKGDKDGMRFLNFSKSAKTGFVAGIVPAAYPKMQPLESYTGQFLRVTGTLETYKKRTQIKVTKISQIKKLSVPKATPAPKKKAS
ncbi:MAG: hypothetical protein IAE97_02480 [Chthoniobacterales bacterium]|nr:hypothetical protein [Chthoniobacterales bacterium]